jgi:hypothetical protein
MRDNQIESNEVPSKSQSSVSGPPKFIRKGMSCLRKAKKNVKKKSGLFPKN